MLVFVVFAMLILTLAADALLGLQLGGWVTVPFTVVYVRRKEWLYQSTDSTSDVARDDSRRNLTFFLNGWYVASSIILYYCQSICKTPPSRFIVLWGVVCRPLLAASQK
jgi:hypothetical protein